MAPALQVLRASTRHRWVLPLVLFGLSMSLYLPAVAEKLVTNDSHAAAVSAWRISATGAPWLDGIDTAELEGTPGHDAWVVRGADGHAVYNRTAGTVLSGVPVYWVLNRTEDPADFKIWVGGVAASIWTASAGVILFLVVRRIVPETLAFAAVLGFLAGTPAWSVSANALWTHNVTIVSIALAMYFVSTQRWLLTGLAFGLGIVARPHLAVVAAIVGLYLGWRRRSWRLVAEVGLGSSLGLAGVSIWNRLVFGTWDVRGGYESYVVDNLKTDIGSDLMYHLENILGFLLAPDRGLLVWTPVLLLLLGPLIIHWRLLPDWIRAFVVAGLTYTLVQLRINTFSGGEGFYGYRLALELVLCMTPALIYTFMFVSMRRRLAVGAILGLQVAVIAVGAFNENYMLPQNRIWTSNAFIQALNDNPVWFGFFVLLGGGLGAAAVYLGESRRGFRADGLAIPARAAAPQELG